MHSKKLLLIILCSAFKIVVAQNYNYPIERTYLLSVEDKINIKDKHIHTSIQPYTSNDFQNNFNDDSLANGVKYKYNVIRQFNWKFLVCYFWWCSDFVLISFRARWLGVLKPFISNRRSRCRYRVAFLCLLSLAKQRKSVPRGISATSVKRTHSHRNTRQENV